MRPFKTVVLDPGHGGIEKGATNIHGMEKDFALDVALAAQADARSEGLPRRHDARRAMCRCRCTTAPRIANATKDCIFVSIHFNATEQPARGRLRDLLAHAARRALDATTTISPPSSRNMQAGSPVDAQSFGLSMSVYHAMLGYMPQFDRGIKRARFAVLRLTQVPAILVEGGFVSEREESQADREQGMARQARAIDRVGIENYRGLAEKKQRPMLLADYQRQFDGVARRDATPTAPACSRARSPHLAGAQPAAVQAALRS